MARPIEILVSPKKYADTFNRMDVKNAPDFNPERGLKIQISEDRLTATLVAKPIWLLGGSMSNILIYEALDNASIHRDRILMKEVDKAAIEIDKILKDPTKVKEDFNFIVAQGNPAKQGESGWIKFYFPRAQRVVLKDDGSADFRNINKYVHVKEGERLATLFEGIAGEQGIDVLGNPIYPNPIDRPRLTLGKNVLPKTIEDPEKPGRQLKEYFASLSGVVFSTDTSLTVSPELNIESNIGLGTGNINFEGTIRVKGTIEEGAIVNCQGSLYLDGNVESSDVVVGEDLEVKGGVKAKGKGVIRIKGDLRTKFIENGNLEIDGDCIVENFILGSKILCLGNVILTGESSSIIGSDITSYQGITVSSLGSTAQMDTVVEVGFHYRNDRLFIEGSSRLAEFERELEALVPEIQKIKEVVQRSRGKLDDARKEKFKEIFDAYQKKSKTVELLKSKIEELKGARYNQDNVKVVVRNTAHPGAVIKYRRQVEKITKAQTAFVMNFFPNQEKALLTAFKGK
ncbi:PF03961 family protein [Leptospira meyeri serovar Semaranga str. Veldrot Semarang 173]|nr:FapA family protein [Leptospira meyeri]EMJ89126.1 PF03961 family protein [Leptospira meyeri serovar Semaranga str. Veldrot Semarang 173]MCW7487877.1 FapA family protein [Leptospira meyeri]